MIALLLCIVFQREGPLDHGIVVDAWQEDPYNEEFWEWFWITDSPELGWTVRFDKDNKPVYKYTLYETGHWELRQSSIYHDAQSYVLLKLGERSEIIKVSYEDWERAVIDEEFKLNP